MDTFKPTEQKENIIIEQFNIKGLQRQIHAVQEL